MDCATAKKRVQRCDAECPADQTEWSTVEGHEVRGALFLSTPDTRAGARQPGCCRCRMVPVVGRFSSSILTNDSVSLLLLLLLW